MVRMNGLGHRALAISIASALAGCLASFDVEGDGDLTPRSEYGRDTVASSLYGIEWTRPSVQKCADRLGLYRVRYTTNGLLLIASAATLGLYVPQTVEWWCEAPAPEGDGELLRPEDELDSAVPLP